MPASLGDAAEQFHANSRSAAHPSMHARDGVTAPWDRGLTRAILFSALPPDPPRPAESGSVSCCQALLAAGYGLIGRWGVGQPPLFSSHLHPIERLLPPAKWKEMKCERPLWNGITLFNSRNDVSRIFVGKHIQEVTGRSAKYC